MTDFTKTIKLRLREPNTGKKKKIEEAMNQSLECANHAIKRMPSLEWSNIERRSGTVYNIVKDLRNNGISLNAKCANQAVEKAREAYISKVVNGEYDTVPEFKNKFVRLHNRDIDGFFERNGTYYVTLKLFPYEKLILPFFPGDYQDYFIEKIVNEEVNYGSGEIKKYDNYYSLNLPIKKEVSLDYEPQTSVGVDLGLNVLAWATAYNRNGEFLDEIHFDGSEAGHIRRRYKKLRDELNRAGNLRMEKEIGSKEQRWMENKNHIISRRIVEFAKQFEKPIIKLEDINGKELRKKTKNPNIHKWTMGKLRNFIEYKAKEVGIKTELINPRNTSRACPKCKYTSEENRNGIDFKCQSCGYENHSDFVGATNITKSESIKAEKR